MIVFDVVSGLIGITLALLSYSHFTIDFILFIWILCHKVLLIMIKELEAAVLIHFHFLIIQISLLQCNLAELLHSIVALESLSFFLFFFFLKNLSFFFFFFFLVHI